VRLSDSADPSVLPARGGGRSDSTRDDRAGGRGTASRFARTRSLVRLAPSSLLLRVRQIAGQVHRLRRVGVRAARVSAERARAGREVGAVAAGDGRRSLEGTRSRGFGRAADARSAPGGLSSRYRGGPEAGSGDAGSGTGRGAKRCARRERVLRREKSRIPARGARGCGAGGRARRGRDPRAARTGFLYRLNDSSASAIRSLALILGMVAEPEARWPTRATSRARGARLECAQMISLSRS
jgi:hypothetical protein